MDKTIRKYTALFRNELVFRQYPDAERKTDAYARRLNTMYASELFQKHNCYPTINTVHVYAVIAMCLELKDYGLSDPEIISFVNHSFYKRKQMFSALLNAIDLLPNCYNIARKWNISDHDKRVKDGSLTYDLFEVSDNKIEYRISHCRYIDMFEAYGIRPLCRIFCLTDVSSYAGLTKHVEFVRHSDLSDGDSCHDEIIKKK